MVKHTTTRIIVAVVLVVFSLDHVKLCKPRFRQAQNAIADNSRRAVDVLEANVKKMREESSRQLATIGRDAKQFFDNALKTMTKAQEAFTNELVPQLLVVGNRTGVLLDNLIIAVQMTHTGLDIGILLLLLFFLYVVQCIRVRCMTGNDIISRGGYLVLSLMEPVILSVVFLLVAKFFYKQMYGIELKMDDSAKLAIVIIVIVLSCYIMLVLWLILQKSLSFIWSSVKYLIWITQAIVTVPFGWVLWNVVPIYLHVGFLVLCVTIVVTLLYFTTSLSNGLILSYIFLFSIGILANVLRYFSNLVPKAVDEQHEKLRKQRLDYFTPNKTTSKFNRPRKSPSTKTIGSKIKANELIRKRYNFVRN